jgi:hypothetical protein
MVMEREIQIYHHLGLGDHIICNGLIRHICKTHDKIYCFVKNHYMDSVSFMYRDEPKIELIGVADDGEVPSKVRRNIAFIRVGFEKLDATGDKFDEIFYKQVGLEFRSRWDNFFIERDYRKESELLQNLKPENGRFIFVHDDPSRDLLIDFSLLRKDLKIIRASDYFPRGSRAEQFREYTLFHWISVLENAQEIHCMDSSFKCLIESLPTLQHTRLFFHRYVKGVREVCSTRKNWNVITRPSSHFMAKNLIRSINKKAKQKLRLRKVALIL